MVSVEFEPKPRKLKRREIKALREAGANREYIKNAKIVEIDKEIPPDVRLYTRNLIFNPADFKPVELGFNEEPDISQLCVGIAWPEWDVGVAWRPVAHPPNGAPHKVELTALLEWYILWTLNQKVKEFKRLSPEAIHYEAGVFQGLSLLNPHYLGFYTLIPAKGNEQVNTIAWIYFPVEPQEIKAIDDLLKQP
ncbi:hypothetical protein DRJ48_01080 [Candidatus Woesearchaeota archaeon]|nr:hypothetical protein [Candidatus Woesearchaeota archaeon]RLE43409.1 MAG: hypothetical protein DRJ48_01080 [Candidatus Woesearchaeota archaeon]